MAGVLDKVSPTTGNTGYYYYFYNWELAVNAECVSSQEAVMGYVVNAAFTSTINGGTVAFADNSTGATSWLWDFGDGATSTLQNPVHTYTTNGPHNVSLSINNGVCSMSDAVNVSVGIEQLADDMSLSIYPNPTTNQTTLSFSQALPEDLNIELIAMDGRILMQTILQTGQSAKVLDLRQLPPAMYLVRLYTGDMVDVRKIIVGAN